MLTEFDPQIYPRLLWIAIGRDQLKETFEDVSVFDENAYAVTESVYHKGKGKSGILIRFDTLDDMSFENVAHESTHAAAEIFRYIGGEMGWVAECIGKVKEMEAKKLAQPEMNP